MVCGGRCRVFGGGMGSIGPLEVCAFCRLNVLFKIRSLVWLCRDSTSTVACLSSTPLLSPQESPYHHHSSMYVSPDH